MKDEVNQMAKLYGRQVFRATVNGKEFVFTCYGQDTSYGFRHICTLGWNDTTVAKYIKSDIIAKSCYYNRTWESFKYETVLNKGINNLDESEEVKAQLKAILIDKTAQDEHERCEKEVQAFQSLWNGLNEENKEHIKNGLGDNLIQTEEQAQAVMGIMKIMTVLQG